MKTTIRKTIAGTIAVSSTMFALLALFVAPQAFVFGALAWLVLWPFSIAMWTDDKW